jgi:hypothetical protein
VCGASVYGVCACGGGVCGASVYGVCVCGAAIFGARVCDAVRAQQHALQSGYSHPGIPPSSTDLNLIAQFHTELHQANRAASTRFAPTGQEIDFGRQSFQGSCQQSRRPCMDSMLQTYRHASNDCVTVTRGSGLLHRRYSQRELHQEVANVDLAILSAAQDREAAPLQNNHGREHTHRPPREQIQVEADQPLTCPNTLALLHMQLEPLAAERHRVDSNMEQYPGPVLRAQSYCVAGGRNRYQLPIARGMEAASGRIDRHSVTEHASGENAVGRLLERGAPTCQRCN